MSKGLVMGAPEWMFGIAVAIGRSLRHTLCTATHKYKPTYQGGVGVEMTEQREVAAYRSGRCRLIVG